MRTDPRRSLPWLLAGLALAGGGALVIAGVDFAQRRSGFETDARIAHRLLSQRATQNEAVLATLALLQPGGSGVDAPERRLPALYPQVLRVQRRAAGSTWDDAALRSAEAASRATQRPALAGFDAGTGRYTLVLAAEPASFAIQIDLQRMVPAGEWPVRFDGPVRIELEHAGRVHLLRPGRAGVSDVWRFESRKPLASDNQLFVLSAVQPVGWRDLPWAALLVWWACVAAAWLALAAWQRQRSERRRVEELLRLGQVGRLNALGELAAGMAHELNQPLTAMLASTQAAQRLLADEPAELATARTAMAQAVQQARRASDVLARLRRAVQRPDLAGRLEPVRLDDALRNVLYLLEPEWRRREVEPQIAHTARADLTVQAEPVALEQIVHNLLMNALYALDEVPAAQRRLALTLATDGAHGVLAVHDSGPGLAPDVLPRVFEPFFSTRAGGLGLGLSLCETLASSMGGSLACRNAPPRGAEFRLALPLAAARTASR